MATPIALAERLQAKVDRSGGPDACWPFTGCRFKSGYGAISAGAGKRNTALYAHRVAWQIAHGRPIPPGLSICHRCDNRPCCNPSHLFLGTTADNMRDMRTKGRHTHGERHPRAVLTPEVVIALRQASAPKTQSITQIAHEIGIPPCAVRLAVAGVTWKHLNAIAAPVKGKVAMTGMRNPSARLTDDAVLEMRALYAAGGTTMDAVSRRFGVSKTRAQSIIRRTTWRHLP